MSPWSAERRALALVCLGALIACGRQDAPPRGVSSAADAGASSEGAGDGGSSAQVAPEAGAPLAWPDAIRRARWTEAAEGLERLPPGERAKAEVRLARARVSIGIGKPADAVAVLDKLDDELPLLRDLVARIRAQAMLDAGPYDKAAEWFGARRDLGSLVSAAEAWEKAGDPVKARVAWDRVLATEMRTDKRPKATEERARLRRMEIVRLKDGELAAQADARWLATNALDEKVFGQAAELLEKLNPPRLLTPEELLARARVLSEAMRIDEALRAIERAATRGNVPAVDLCRARAEVYYKARSRYPEAALAYRTCSNMGGAHAAEDAFLSARAFSRADRDGDAVPAFQAVMQKHPRTVWADQAEFHIARMHALAGRWKDAAVAFDEYVAHWPTGKEKREAERYRALSHLVSRNDKRARKLLEDLVGGAEDSVTAARWMNLAALAALRDGDRVHALARWAEVARSRPLSYPALVARSRIVENGGALPPTIEPAESAAAPELPTIELPPPADMLHRIGFDAEAEDVLREREAVIVSKVPTRGTDALCAAYGLLDRGKRRYQISLQTPAQLIATAPGGRNRGAWECLFPRPYDGVVRDAAARSRVSAELVWSVMRQESAFDPEVVSPARAVGLMQLLPETARATATLASIPHDDSKLTSPSQNIVLGTLYLRELLDKFGDKEPLAVAAYNAGPEAVQRWLSHAKPETLDVFVEAIPFVETRGYVVRVLGNLARYGYMDRGEAGVPTIALALK